MVKFMVQSARNAFERLERLSCVRLIWLIQVPEILSSA